MDPNSDVDFNDVFGGPPRRSTVQETRYSFGENLDSSSSGFDEAVIAHRNPWSVLSEKPVFGEEGTTNQRRYSKNDFFYDIFRGNQSLTCSPRKYEVKDPFEPASQLLSPCRPLPPKAEPFSSSFPSQFSLPAKLNKGMDLPISKRKDGSSNGSSYHAYSPMSRFSVQANQDKDQETRSSFQGDSKEDTSSLDITGNDNRFHFSIYKWADKGGVPFAIPLRGSHRFKEKDNKLQSCSSANGWIPCESIAIEPKANFHNNFSSTDRMSSNEKNKDSFPIDWRNEVNEPVRIIEEDNIPKPESESWPQSTDKKVSGDTVLPSSKEEKKTRYSPRNSWDNRKGRDRGKVKEFIKIFNQETSPKPGADIVSENHSFRLKQRHNNVEPETGPRISMTQKDEKTHMPNMQKENKISPDVRVGSSMLNSASEMNTNGSRKDTVSDGSKSIADDPTESSEVNFSIEDLTLVSEEKIFPEYGMDHEEIQAIDAKIRQWSNGKQGNIRSLLSTLQYVLWADSGWKPVPLTHIIEGRAVKKSYQKALLYLHPDKLQQKGAASYKKYIVEKVFDILQDAWTQFNLLDSI
ncbi:J-domain protein required for chloroplast accumulation response 1, putative isoform 3 [Hibiscus syriacus]|uniref:J-domain protein required for chloroplast accumulation response 1, putative isoform 3 n=1 Tax=Hibiscus syriacus TaxID=106335 RepID=A0A6A2XWB3_HIBSY|nr:J domain-containing protein required for chloroplast accumulation response 1-like [Hibiscus syriacus]KAE8679878.1 J-domain protein required for chloroplast accumulation response 1, putative isoform 3 [Hibiscus syriacus]